MWRTLTYPLGVVVVLHRLYMWLQLIRLIANVHPLIFHDLLRKKQTAKVYTPWPEMLKTGLGNKEFYFW